MKTSTFLTLSTSVLLGALDISSANSPPPPEYLLSSRGLHPSRTYNYDLPTQTPSSTNKHSKYTKTPFTIIEDPIPVPDVESPDITDPPPIPQPQIPTEGYYELPNGTLIAVELRDGNPKPVTKDDYVSNLSEDPIPVPDVESPDISDPPPIPQPQIPTKGYYELPNGNLIAVELRDGNPKPVTDDYVSNPDDWTTSGGPHPPPPFPGDVVYGDGVKRFPLSADLQDKLDKLVESESPLLVSDVTGKDPSYKIQNRDLGDLRDAADDFLADFRKKYEGLKQELDDFKFPDFSDLNKYLPSGIDVDVSFGGTEVSDPPPHPPKGQYIDDTVFVEPIPRGETIVEPIPEGETIVEPIPPKFTSRPPPAGYDYHITVSAPPPARTTFATVTRSSGTTRPSNAFDYEYTLTK